MQDGAFQPASATVLVTGGPVQVVSVNLTTSYRIRNVTTTNSYIAWAAPLGGGGTPAITCQPPTISAAPAVINTLGMVASSVEVFRLPGNAWFKGSAGGTFEVTAGEGV